MRTYPWLGATGTDRRHNTLEEVYTVYGAQRRKAGKGVKVRRKDEVYQNPLLAPRGINPGRTWLESYNQPITVGHVLVMPGDVIVADGDGVAVVPRARAEEVAGIARWIFEDDEWKRGNIYDRVKKPRDWTVNGHVEQPPPSKSPIK